MNMVNLIGRLTADPVVRYTATQTAVASFSLAINRGKDRDGNDLGADFPRVCVFGRQAENCEKYLWKGDRCAITGRIQTGKYKNKSGDTVYTTDVIASRVEFLETRTGRRDAQREPSQKQEEFADRQLMHDMTPDFAEIDDDVPF